MSILLTGSEGFIGRNLLEQFLAEGRRVLHPTVAELDLTSADRVDDYFRSNRVDVVVHSATSQRAGTAYATNAAEDNLRMFFNLARNVAPGMKLINFGSGIEYSRKHWQRKMPETYFDRHVPDDSIGFSKYLISKYVMDSHRLPMVSLRIFGVFGKYEDYRFKFISNAIAKNLLGLPIVINQNVFFDYLYVPDFYAVVRYFVENQAGHRDYNVTPTESADLVTIAGIVNDIGERRSEIRVLNEGIGVHYTGDNGRLAAEMKGFRTTSLRDAIAELYGYFRERVSTLDRAALEKDDYLSYAKSLKKEYFAGEARDRA